MSTVSAHNLPIQCNLNDHKSLQAVQKAVGGTSSLHLTLAFCKMEDSMLERQAAVSIKNSIQQDATCKAIAENILLHFTKFELLPHQVLVACYEARNIADQQPATVQYHELVNRCRDKVRNAANDLDATKQASFKQSESRNCEEATVNGKKAYSMDTREPFIHVTLKRHATTRDLVAANALAAASGEVPEPIKICLQELSTQPTQATRI